MRRRRYDTVGLVEDLRRERRKALVLLLTGVSILLFLFIIYVTVIRHDNATDMPEQTNPESMTGSSANKTLSDKQAAKSDTLENPIETKTTPEGKSVENAIVNVNLPRKVPVWLDGKSLGKLKVTSLALSPGSHEIKIKLGKKSVTQILEVEAGKSYDFHGPGANQPKKAKTKKNR